MSYSIAQEIQMTAPVFCSEPWSLVNSEGPLESFGDSSAVFRNRQLLVRLVRERSKILVDIGVHACQSKWWPLEYQLAVEDPPPAQELSPSIDAVLRHLEKLQDRVSGDLAAAIERLDRIEAQNRARTP
jgi:hypothetical protein